MQNKKNKKTGQGGSEGGYRWMMQEAYPIGDVISVKVESSLRDMKKWVEGRVQYMHVETKHGENDLHSGLLVVDSVQVGTEECDIKSQGSNQQYPTEEFKKETFIEGVR